MEQAENLPAETSVPQDIEARLASAARLAAKGTHFYQGSVNLPRYTKNLVGEGFFVTSDVQYKTRPKNDKREFASEVVQFTIRRIGQGKGGKPILLESELATLSGAYLLNQVRGMTINELHSYPWTVWENDLFEIRQQTDGRKHPYMLALYNPQIHQPVQEDDGDSELARDPLGPNWRNKIAEATDPITNLNNAMRRGRSDLSDVYADFPTPNPVKEAKAKLWQEDWTAFNIYLRAAKLSLSDAREYLGMQDGETWQGRDLAEDRAVIDALRDEPSEDESPQEAIVGRGRGRPRKS